MPDLLLELFSEEIPARMQRQAAEDLKRLVTNALVERNLTLRGRAEPSSPRGALTLHVVGLPAAQPDLREERKGPRVGAPDAAIQGFLKSAGLARIEDATIETRPEEGRVLCRGRSRSPAARPRTRSPRSSPRSSAPSRGRSRCAGARPRRSPTRCAGCAPCAGIVCTLAIPHDASEIVPFEVDGINAGDVTFGHRFMAPGPIQVRRFDDYVEALQKAKVVLDAERRKAIILADARNLAFAQGLELVEDEGLLEEVAGLVEWPVVLMGEFEPAFLDIPPEVIRATIRANQKCFVLRDGDGRLANKFILVSNLVASDGGAAIAAGNARVVRARLADARHFWQTDLAALPDYKDKSAKPLDQRLAKLEALGIVFHEKLGTQGERIERIEALARELAPQVGADVALAARAAQLAKADLVTEMVGEFPELQGLMGRYYAAAQGEEPSVADAIEEHYKPQGPNDRIPTAPVSIAVALADKLDTLAGFWAIDEKPTGSKDPYALRRAALGVIRIVLENGLQAAADCAHERRRLGGHARHRIRPRGRGRRGRAVRWRSAASPRGRARRGRRRRDRARRRTPARTTRDFARPPASLLAFFADRLKVYLRDKGARHDLIDAVFALPGQDDLLMIVWRVEALGQAARHRGRQEPARRLSPRRQHPARRGEKGRRAAPSPARTIRPCSRCRPKRTSPTFSPRRARRRASGRAARISRARCGRSRPCARRSTLFSST